MVALQARTEGKKGKSLLLVLCSESLNQCDMSYEMPPEWGMTACLLLTGINVPTAFPGLQECTFPQEGTEAWGGEQVLCQASRLSFTSRGLVSGHSMGEAWGRRGSDFEVMSFMFTLHIYNAQPVPGTAVTAL